MPNAPKSFRLYPAKPPPNGGKSPEAYARARKYRTKAWEQIRIGVIARDGGVCRLCGHICVSKGEAHVDHAVAVADGGADDEDNLRVLCASCHSKRTAREHGVGGG